MSFKSPDSRISSAAPQTLPLLRPMEVGELLDEAFDLFKKNFRLFAGIAVLISVPLSVLVVATPPTSDWRYAVNILSSLASIVTYGALTEAVLQRHLGRQTSLAAAYRLGARRFLRLFSAYVILFLAILIGLVALIIPGLIVSLWGLLLVPIVVAENRSGIGALKRARQLSEGNLWRVFFVSLGLFLVVLIFFTVLAALGGLIGATLGGSQSEPVDRSDAAMLVIQGTVVVISVLMQAAWSPVFAAAALLAYLDLRIRREAYDLELVTIAVEERVAAARVPAAVPEQASS